MKALKSAPLFAAILILAGAPALQAAVPNLVGTWTGTGKAVGIEHGYYSVSYTVTIIDQNGNLFRGSIKVTTPIGTYSQKFTGIIKADNTICANYRDSSGDQVTEALSFGKYVAPTAAKPKAGYEGYWIDAFTQDTGTMSLLKK
jgi:hypothetical protein